MTCVSEERNRCRSEGFGAYHGTEQGLHLELPKSLEIELHRKHVRKPSGGGHKRHYSGIVHSIAGVVDTDPEGGKGLLRRMRDDVRCVRRPLLYLIDEIHGEIMVKRNPGVAEVSMLTTTVAGQ